MTLVHATQQGCACWALPRCFASLPVVHGCQAVVPLLAGCVPAQGTSRNLSKPNQSCVQAEELHPTPLLSPTTNKTSQHRSTPALPHQISNFTLNSGMVLVKKAAPTVEACTHQRRPHEQMTAEQHAWTFLPGESGVQQLTNHYQHVPDSQKTAP